MAAKKVADWVIKIVFKQSKIIRRSKLEGENNKED